MALKDTVHVREREKERKRKPMRSHIRDRCVICHSFFDSCHVTSVTKGVT